MQDGLNRSDDVVGAQPSPPETEERLPQDYSFSPVHYYEDDADDPPEPPAAQ